MFKRHASLRIAGLRRLGPRPGMPRGTVAAHANDNLPGLRRPAGQRRSPPPGLACHWVPTDGNRLECRWQIDPGEIGIEEPGGRRGTRNPDRHRHSGSIVRCHPPGLDGNDGAGCFRAPEATGVGVLLLASEILRRARALHR